MRNHAVVNAGTKVLFPKIESGLRSTGTIRTSSGSRPPPPGGAGPLASKWRQGSNAVPSEALKSRPLADEHSKSCCRSRALQSRKRSFSATLRRPQQRPPPSRGKPAVHSCWDCCSVAPKTNAPHGKDGLTHRSGYNRNRTLKRGNVAVMRASQGPASNSRESARDADPEAASERTSWCRIVGVTHDSRTSARRYQRPGARHQRAGGGDRSGTPHAARSGGGAESDRRLSHLRPAQPRRDGARSAGGAGDHRSARQNRRFGRLDRDDQRRVRPVRVVVVAGELRAGLPQRPRRDHCRLRPAGGDGRGGGRWLARQRTVAVRERLPACRLDLRASASWPRTASRSPARRARRWSAAFSCRRATGGSRTPGTSRGSRGLEAIISRSATCWSRRQASSILRPACRACPGPLYQAVPQFLPLLHATVDVGVAGAALDDLIALAATGRQQLKAAVSMRESETFQFELGRVAAGLRAARAFHRAQVASHWRHALAGTLKDEALLAQGTQAAIWVATTCVGVADACFTLGRRQRDLRNLAAAAAAARPPHRGATRRRAATTLRQRGKAAPGRFRRRFETRRCEHRRGRAYGGTTSVH